MPSVIAWQFLLHAPPRHASAASPYWAGDLSAEITAIVTAVYAVRAFRKQTQEVTDQATMLKVQSNQLDEQRKINAEQTRVLELQARELQESLDERKCEGDERRRAQASRLFIWQERGPQVVTTEAAARGETGSPSVIAHIVNAGQQPVYNVIISWRLGSQPRRLRYLTPLMPGDENEDTQPIPPEAEPGQFSPVAFFRDAAGVTWRTHPDGQLDEIPAGQEPPHSW
ncbi:MAG TPA: hypothetical protein VFQ68_19240 [Streptosporangiaceae bacterium]|nr:hypothetical protein [Streptosporangiaceae bacterium]